MKNFFSISKSFVILAFVLFCYKNVQSQNILYNMIVGDTVVLAVSNYTSGTIQWQQSTDSLAWSDIPGATVNSQKIVTTASPTNKRFFRANVGDDNLCASHIVKSSVIRNRILASTMQIVVGDLFHGGIVYFVSGTGSGLIATQHDQSYQALWGVEGTSIPGALSLSNGAANTAAIVAAGSSSTYPFAASVCDTLSISSYNNWFLPAKDQLVYLHQQQSILGLGPATYWSSSEYDNSTAWSEAFPMPNQLTMSKSSFGNVRCISTYGAINVNKTYCSATVAIGSVYQNEKICLVTVDTITWKNKVMWEKTANVGAGYYLIHKENGLNNYNQIGYVLASQPGEYIDLFSVPESHGDKYKISLLDTCGNESAMSSYHKTMNLVISSFGNTMGLMWDDYVDESGLYSPFRYYIYRGTSPSNMSLLDSVSGSFNSYNDVNVFNVYYYIIGVKKLGGCNTTKSNIVSYSNKKDNSTLLGINSATYSTITVSPNPFTESTTITIPNSLITNYELKIIDITGKTVRTITNLNRHAELVSASPKSPQQIATNLSGSRNDLQIVIERGNLKPGVYFIELRGDRVYRGKLIVE